MTYLMCCHVVSPLRHGNPSHYLNYSHVLKTWQPVVNNLVPSIIFHVILTCLLTVVPLSSLLSIPIPIRMPLLHALLVLCILIRDAPSFIVQYHYSIAIICNA